MVPAVSDVPAKELSDAQLADAFADQRLLVQAWNPAVNPHLQRFTELSLELLSRQQTKPAEERILVTGERYIVPISPQENKTTITDQAAVYRAIRVKGTGVLLGAYKITLAAARKLLSEKQQAKWLKTERTGPREIGEPVLKEARP